MRQRSLFLVAGCALAFLSACTVRETPETERPRTVTEPLFSNIAAGYRLRPTIWALERVSKDRTAIWVWTAEGGCASFHHAEISEDEAGVRVVVFERVPAKKDIACTLELILGRHRIELPRPLGDTTLLGACTPGDATAEQRMCAHLHSAF